MSTSSKAANVTIKNRKPVFDFSDTPPVWLSTPQATHFMNALSVLVPVSERLVIERLRVERKSLTNKRLLEEIESLIKQEGLHAKLHRDVNQALVACGFTVVPAVEALQSRAMKLLQRVMPHTFVQSIPAALEHFTAAISRSVLGNPAFWFGDRAESDATRFLRWHALEELEHQAVCFDVYRSLGNRPLVFSLSLMLFWMPASALSMYGLQGYFLGKQRKLHSINDWRAYLTFMGKTLPIFFSGAWKYSRKTYTPWSATDLELYRGQESQRI